MSCRALREVLLIAPPTLLLAAYKLPARSTQPASVHVPAAALRPAPAHDLLALVVFDREFVVVAKLLAGFDVALGVDDDLLAAVVGDNLREAIGLQARWESSGGGWKVLMHARGNEGPVARWRTASRNSHSLTTHVAVVVETVVDVTVVVVVVEDVTEVVVTVVLVTDVVVLEVVVVVPEVVVTVVVEVFVVVTVVDVTVVVDAVVVVVEVVVDVIVVVVSAHR